MGLKEGNGGHGLEEYSEETGRYIQDGQPNSSYDNPNEKPTTTRGHALSFLNRPSNKDLLDFYNSLDDSDKDAFLDAVIKEMQLDDEPVAETPQRTPISNRDVFSMSSEEVKAELEELKDRTYKNGFVFSRKEQIIRNEIESGKTEEEALNYWENIKKTFKMDDSHFDTKTYDTFLSHDKRIKLSQIRAFNTIKEMFEDRGIKTGTVLLEYGECLDEMSDCVAWCSPSEGITYNKLNRYLSNIGSLKTLLTSQRDIKHLCPCTNAHIFDYLPYHEFGHWVSDMIIEKMFPNNISEESKAEREAIKEWRDDPYVDKTDTDWFVNKLIEFKKQYRNNVIKKALVDYFKTEDLPYISEYAKTNSNEYFSECFANALCGRTTEANKGFLNWVFDKLSNEV